MRGPTDAFELVLIEADGHTTALVLPPGSAFIGSSTMCSVVIADPSVAPVHAELMTSTDGAVWIRDLAKRHDTRVNGQAVETMKLEHGAFIRLGDVELCLRSAGKDSGEHGTAIRQSATPATSLGLAKTAASGEFNPDRPTPSGLNMQFPNRPSSPVPPPAEDDGHGATRLGKDVIGPNVIIADRYKVIGKLSEGGMGEVYRALHIELDKPVALKVMKQALGDDPGFAERFKREAVAASRIGQENICDVSDFGRTASGRFFFVMELLDGQTLGALIRTAGALPIPRAIAVMDQLCHALAAAHSQGIVHRDLKPENVMLLQRPRRKDFVKVLDFGVAKVRLGGDAVGTQVGLVIGTPQYMAPEQASGLLTDARTDVYALGLIFYEMLQGKPAFNDETPGQLMAAQIYRDPPGLRSASGAPLPEQVQALVSAMLAKAPDKRPQSMEDVLTRLEACTANLAAPAKPTPAPLDELDPPIGVSQLNPTTSAKWPLVLGGLVLAIGSVAVGMAVGGKGPQPVVEAVAVAPPPPPAPVPPVKVAAPEPAPLPVEVNPAPKPAPPPPVKVARPRPVAVAMLGSVRVTQQTRCPLRISPETLKLVGERISVPVGTAEVRLEADCPGTAQLLGVDDQPYAAGIFGKGRPLTLRVRN